MYTKCEQCYASVIVYYVEKDIIIRLEGVYISVLEHYRRGNLVCAGELTMYVHSTCINVNRKDFHA